MPTVAEQIVGNPLTYAGLSRWIDFFRANLSYLKAVSIFTTLVLLGLTVFFMIKIGWIATRVDRVRDVILKSDLPKKRVIKSWHRVTRHYFAGDEVNLKLAILEADKILDDALRVAGARGETMADRLKSISTGDLPIVNELWEAHRVRNRIAHEQNYNLDRLTADKALSIYQKAFQELGLLD